MLNRLIVAVLLWVSVAFAQYYPPIGGGSGGSGITTITVTGPIAGGGTSSTVNVRCPTCVTSASALTANALMIGGGLQASSTLASLGTTTTVLHGNAAGAPTFGAVSLTADVSGNLPVTNLNSGTSASSSTWWRGDGTWTAVSVSGQTCTNQAITVISTSGGGTCTTITSAYVNNSIALTGTDINTSNQVTVTHLASALPAAQGGTGVANTATLTLGSSNQNWGTLGTGIVKNTTTTGALTNAAAADVYGLFTSCTGSSGLFLKDGGTCAAAGSSGIVFGTTTTSGGTTNGIMYGDGSVVQSASGITRTAAGTLTFTTSVIAPLHTAAAGVAPALNTTAAAQTTSTTAGVGLTITADNAVAGSSSVGAAAGGNITLTAGSAARLTSGNANGGNVSILAGAGIGTGTQGQVLFGTTSGTSSGTAAVPAIAFANSTGTGFYLRAGSNAVDLAAQGVGVVEFGNALGALFTTNGPVVGFTGASTIGSPADTGIFRVSAGVLGVGKGSTTANGTINAAGATFLDPTATTGATRVTVSLGAADSSSTVTLTNAGTTKSAGYQSSDGSAGVTTTFSAGVQTCTVKNGLITGCA